jgi:mRNA-degrading endonuclease RelE of RelBE toxin-antitoxin system
MSFSVIATEPFERKLKRLTKKYRSLKIDLLKLIEQLEENPNQGTPIGKECYKIRLAISDKSKGKSAGARVITYVRIVSETVFLMDIYDKSEQANITSNELEILIEILAQ